MKNIIFAIATLCASIVLAQCPDENVMDLIKLAKIVKERLTYSLWSEWMDIPMTTLLVDDGYEYALNTKGPDTSFHSTCQNLQVRPAQFDKSFLATFPLLKGKPTIVVGTPKNTGKKPAAWTATLLHEHFHQLQFSKPTYFTDQRALKLDKGDETGMWVLNHPFPYEDDQVNDLMKAMALNLLSGDSLGYEQVLEQHKRYKAKLKEQIGSDHYKYLNHQLWQEGYARYIELELVNDWIANFDQIDQQRFTLYEIEVLRENQMKEVISHLTKSSPKELKRVYFYALGAAEAKLIAQTNPQWKAEYFDEFFTTDHLLK